MKVGINLPSEVKHHHCRYSFNYSPSTRENLGNDAHYVRSNMEAERPFESTGS
jgi:hypothetical protein